MVVDLIAELAGLVALPEPIVEFGSLQVEPDQPGDLRPLFAGLQFLGTDMRQGPGVDRVEDLRRLSFADEAIGTALCLDTLEHCEDPLTACREMHRVLAPGGLCVISSVMFFPIHGYPQDFWRFTPEGFRRLLAPFSDVWVGAIGHPELPLQVIGVASKDADLGLATRRFNVVEEAQEMWLRAEGKIRFDIVHVSVKQLIGALVRELPRAAWQRAGARVRERAGARAAAVPVRPRPPAP